MRQQIEMYSHHSILGLLHFQALVNTVSYLLATKLQYVINKRILKRNLEVLTCKDSRTLVGAPIYTRG